MNNDSSKTTTTKSTKSATSGTGTQGTTENSGVISLVNQLNEVNTLKAQLEQKQKEVETARNQRMQNLHTEFGFQSSDEFIRVYRGVVAPANGQKSGNGRGKVTDAMRNQIKEMTEAGKTGKEMAEKLGISLPTVQNVKKALGLVRSR